MDDFDIEEANLIIAELRRLHDELEQISNAGDRLKHTRQEDEIAHFSDRLKYVKKEIKLYARYGTIDKTNRKQTWLEYAFFSGALFRASAQFSLHTNAPPSKWVTGIYTPSFEISYYLSQLEDLVKKRRQDHGKSQESDGG